MRVLQGLRAHRFGKRGFTLVELAIVLAVAALLFAGLWRLMAGGNSQLRNQAAADQQRQLIAAVKAFLAFDAGQPGGFLVGLGSPPPKVGGTANLPIPTALEMAACAPTTMGAAAFCRFLPAGFNNNTSNSYGQTYLIGVRLDQLNGTTPIAWSFMIITQTGQVIPDSEGASIAGLTGGDGGFIYTANVCGPNPIACGVYGSWAVDPTQPGLPAPGGYGFPAANVVAGHVASLTSVNQATAAAATTDDIWLARKDALDTNLLKIFSATSTSYPDKNLMQNPLVIAGPGVWPGGPAAGTAKATNILPGGEPDNRRDIYTLGNNIFMGIGAGAGTFLPPVATSGGLFLDGGFIDGGVGLSWSGGTVSSARPSGMIQNVRQAILGFMPTAVGGADGPTFSTPPSLLVTGPNDSTPGVGPADVTGVSPTMPEWSSDCFYNPPSGVACKSVLEVHGNAVVVGKLGALNLFAQSFVYDTGSSSDMRLKMDIRKLDNPLDKLSRIAAVSYYMKGTETRKKLGVLAQEVEKVYPELVFESNGSKAVDYMGLVGPLVGAVKELRDQNLVLRRQVREQEERLRKIEER